MKAVTYPQLHEVIWKAQLLAQVSRLAIGGEDLRAQIDLDAQAMLDHLWELGFRPSLATMMLVDAEDGPNPRKLGS